MSSESKKHDLTVGSPGRVLVKFTFPLLVRENLFAEALCVLILGIYLTPSGLNNYFKADESGCTVTNDTKRRKIMERY